ncbi:MAG: hypothetical protein QGG54_10720 [Gammaproteobacteria bacterium]|jgi:hypothetical protein|nr:hypothetical protein [Gammaproteobacteria bacterium]MDP6537525.1 hypothetical protein [Gammaproteobacteria bacterium]MDP6733280.1 hypothetical protein [Gammaproteobacteria bacterium]HAJ75686.1 hypothetical protein [Gammaproteobacteria bacterium]|tara:strand:+ start:331 stop:768 length:438 start_codon:yes stop_codon:yes gene_type:complete
MKTIGRNILAVLLGGFIGGLVNMGLIIGGSSVIPAPAGVDVTSTESLAASMNLFEPHHFLFPFLAHALGTATGAVIAHMIAASHKQIFAYLIGVFFLLGGIANAFMIPAPEWFIAADLLLAYLPMAALGSLVAVRLDSFKAAEQS